MEIRRQPRILFLFCSSLVGMLSVVGDEGVARPIRIISTAVLVFPFLQGAERVSQHLRIPTIACMIFGELVAVLEGRDRDP